MIYTQAIIGATRPLGQPVHPDLGALAEERERRRGAKADGSGQAWERGTQGGEGSWEDLQVADAVRGEGAKDVKHGRRQGGY